MKRAPTRYIPQDVPKSIQEAIFSPNKGYGPSNPQKQLQQLPRPLQGPTAAAALARAALFKDCIYY